MNKKNSGFPWRTAAALLIAGLSLTATATPGQAVTVCGPRYISQNIKDAVLAAKAAKYCTGMPYTLTQALAFVDRMRCTPEASKMIDDLLFNNEDRFVAVLTGDARQAACEQAAKIKVIELSRR